MRIYALQKRSGGMRHADVAPLVDFVQVSQFISARHRTASEKAFCCQGFGMSLCQCARVMHNKFS